MSDEAIKKRQARAKEKAASDLRALGYDIFPSDNKRVCLFAVRPGDVRLIRICVDEITQADRKIVSKIDYTNVELWLRRKGEETFVIQNSKTLSRG